MYKVEILNREATETYYSDPVEHYHNDDNYDGRGDSLEKSFETPEAAFSYIKDVGYGYWDWDCFWNETARKNDLRYYLLRIMEYDDDDELVQECYTAILGTEPLDKIEKELVEEWKELHK